MANFSDSESRLLLREVGTARHSQHTEGERKNEGENVNEFLFFGTHKTTFLLFQTFENFVGISTGFNEIHRSTIDLPTNFNFEIAISGNLAKTDR